MAYKIVDMRLLRFLRFFVFASLVYLIIAAGHRLVVQRLVFDAGIEPPLSTLLYCAIALGGFLALAPYFLPFQPWLKTARAIAWPGAVWMGLFFYLLLFTGISDLAILLANIDRSVVGKFQAISVLAISSTMVLTGLIAALKLPAVRRIEIKLDRWPKKLDGFRILQISDLHLGPFLRDAFARSITTRCNALKPDIVVITGDLVDGSVKKIGDAVTPLTELVATHGVFYVTGNHEYYCGVRSWTNRIAELGIEVLRNRSVFIGDKTAGFYLAGTNDYRGSGWGADQGEDLQAALSSIDHRYPVVLLAHNPETFRSASRLNIDLQLSGHTHGGQIWPFGCLIRLQTQFIAGLYRRNRAQLYVSRGTGFWGPPMRVFAPSEITEILIRSLHS